MKIFSSLFKTTSSLKPSREGFAEVCRAREATTHRHLVFGEVVQAGDIYGGEDWGFVFTIGTPQVERPQPGESCDGLLGYRIRRKL